MTGATLRRSLLAVLTATAIAATTGACGVPTGGDPEAIPAAEIPAELTSRPPAATSGAAEQTAGQPVVYLVDPADVLVPRGRPVEGDARDQLDDLLDSLAAGPTAAERADGLATALSAQAGLAVGDLSGGTATVELTGVTDTVTGQQSRRAVAQVVLTVTSLPAVQRVLLTQDGDAVEAPLPSGELTSRPLTATDYGEYLTPPP